MVKILSKFFITLFVLFSLNGCSTVYDSIDLAGIVDKTENFIFGNEEEGTEDLDKNNIIVSEELDEESLEIEDIPTQRPEFSDIEQNFFDGEDQEETIVKDIKNINAEVVTEKKVEELTSEDKNINVISNMSQNVRMRVRMLLLKSDPPTASTGKEVLYEQEKNKVPNFKEDDKVAVFFFPNNSVLPDAKAEEVVNEIVKIYINNRLLLVGHSSTLGGNSPEGKKVNMELSFARAESIKKMLTTKGFPEENITVLGKGDLEPSVKLNTNNKDSNDRRVEVFLFSN